MADDSLYSASTYGKTLACAFVTTAALARRYRLTTSVAKPILFILKASQRCYIRVGNSSVAATANDIELDADKEYPLKITKADRAYISVFGVSASGTLKITNTSEDTDDASEAPSAV